MRTILLLLAGLALASCSGANADAPPARAAGTNPYRARPVGTMPDLGEHAYTFVVPVKIGEDRWYLVGRATWEGNATLLTAPDGRIPIFPRENDAWELAQRVMPMSRGQSTEAAMMRDMRQKVIGNRTIDLDAARKYAMELERDHASPEAVMEAWELLAWAGELFAAPKPTRTELEIEPQRAGDRKELAADAGLRASVRALHAIVIRSKRFQQMQEAMDRGKPDADWPFGGDIWATHDDRRLAPALLAAYDAFSERLSEDVGDVERSLRGH